VKHSFFIAALNGLQDLEEELAGHLFPQVTPARDIVKQVLGNEYLGCRRSQINWLNWIRNYIRNYKTGRKI
jgi:hypothetical protein